MTVSAPDWRSRLAFSSSRTLVVIGTLGLSCRTVSVMSTAASSRLAATMTARARSTEARRSTSVRPGVADDPGQPDRVGLVDRPRLGVDDDDLVQRRPVGLQRADGAAALGAVAAHDDVLAHAGPPASDAELLARARGERLEGRPDQDEQEGDPQRRDHQDVDEPGAGGDRGDVAVAGGGEGDRRVVGRVEHRDLVAAGVPVAVAVEVDDQDGQGQHDRRDDDPAQHLADGGLLLVGDPDTGVLGLRGLPLAVHRGDDSERAARGGRDRRSVRSPGGAGSEPGRRTRVEPAAPPPEVRARGVPGSCEGARVPPPRVLSRSRW